MFVQLNNARNIFLQIRRAEEFFGKKKNWTIQKVDRNRIEGRFLGEYSYVVRSGLDLRVQSMLILVPEWRITDQKDVKNDTARPDVDWLAVWLFLQDFRAEVTGRPSETFLHEIIRGHSPQNTYIFFVEILDGAVFS